MILQGSGLLWCVLSSVFSVARLSFRSSFSIVVESCQSLCSSMCIYTELYTESHENIQNIILSMCLRHGPALGRVEVEFLRRVYPRLSAGAFADSGAERKEEGRF